ncbi:MAG TPA: hypothetical protein VF669_20785, partial [Tepidisphaeraceae bacterium]
MINLVLLACLMLAGTALAAHGAPPASQPGWTTTDIGQTLFHPFKTAPYPHPSRAEGLKTKSTTLPYARHYDDSTVAIFIPAHFKTTERTNFIVHFHGHQTYVERMLRIHLLREQLAASKVNTILVVPQGPKEASDSGCGKLELDNDGFKNFVTEIVSFLKNEGKIPTTTIGQIALSAHSGGYKVTASVLDHGGMTSHISDVLLLDATYSNLEWFSAWCAGGKDRRLVSLFTDHLADENKQLMSLLEKSNVQHQSLDEDGITNDQLRSRQPL